MRLCILQRKLMFLLRLTRPDNSAISAKVFQAVKEKGVKPLIVQQCRILKHSYNTNFTSPLLGEEMQWKSNHGIQGSTSLWQLILMILSAPTFKDHVCPYWDTIIPKDQHFGEHVAQKYLSKSASCRHCQLVEGLRQRYLCSRNGTKIKRKSFWTQHVPSHPPPSPCHLLHHLTSCPLYKTRITSCGVHICTIPNGQMNILTLTLASNIELPMPKFHK